MPAIFLRTFGADDNPSGSSPFVSIPVPIGVKDGDFVVAAIVLPAANVTVTPPDGWMLITQTDPTLTTGIVAFWHMCLNEQARWVFALSGSAAAAGVALVYGSTDPFLPIEVSAAKLTASGTSHAVQGVEVAEDGEELALFLAAHAVGTYTPASGFRAVVAKQQSAATIAAHRRQPAAAGAVADFNVTFSTSAAAATLLLAIRPTVGRFSIDEVRQRVIDDLPEGVEDVYDLTASGDYYKYFNAVAALLKYEGFDLVDILRQESFVSRARYDLADWERLFGLLQTRIAKHGTIPQRQAQVVAAWRVAAGQEPSLPEIRALVGAYLGYTDPSAVDVRECQRGAMRTLHSYKAVAGDIPGPGSLTRQVYVADYPRVGKMGVQLSLFIDHPSAEDLTVTLTGPSSPAGQASKSWTLRAGALASSEEIRLYDISAAGKTIWGTWTLTITSGGAAGTLDHALVFVEGIGRDQQGHDGLGGALFEWGVFVDPTLVNGGAGGFVDYRGVQRILDQFTQSHRVARVIRGSLTTDIGTSHAFPGDTNCIPGQIVPHTNP